MINDQISKIPYTSNSFCNNQEHKTQNDIDEIYYNIEVESYNNSNYLPMITNYTNENEQFTEESNIEDLFKIDFIKDNELDMPLNSNKKIKVGHN